MQKRPVPDNRSFLHNGQNLAANLCTGVLYRNGYFLAHVKIGCARTPLLFICDQYEREKTYERSRGVPICLLLLLCFILFSLYLFAIQSPIPFFNITIFLKMFYLKGSIIFLFVNRRCFCLLHRKVNLQILF